MAAMKGSRSASTFSPPSTWYAPAGPASATIRASAMRFLMPRPSYAAAAGPQTPFGLGLRRAGGWAAVQPCGGDLMAAGSGLTRRRPRFLRLGAEEAGLALGHHPAALVNLDRLEDAGVEIGIFGEAGVERGTIGKVE